MSDGMQQLSNGVKLVSETVLPGSSLLMDGRVKEGAAHMAVGLAARAFLGPIGWGIVAANSFSKSVSDQGIVDHVTDVAKDAKDALKSKKSNVVEAEIVESEEPAEPAEPAAKKTTAAKSTTAKA
ncbi:DUF6072 family protein [Terasakiella sp. A23]|uniref:DUF6072 family protein n=1 Tax=Terasakiella sp. FCG-A23 TaxID=3080561 RepID=UPI0029538CCF|nr:DUF6072 family protein [Terasakiella sp. A23]MDV7340259.1 DUF6072 family protein [Terasakiella sp. A23]